VPAKFDAGGTGIVFVALYWDSAAPAGDAETASASRHAMPASSVSAERRGAVPAPDPSARPRSRMSFDACIAAFPPV